MVLNQRRDSKAAYSDSSASSMTGSSNSSTGTFDDISSVEYERQRLREWERQLIHHQLEFNKHCYQLQEFAKATQSWVEKRVVPSGLLLPVAKRPRLTFSNMTPFSTSSSSSSCGGSGDGDGDDDGGGSGSDMMSSATLAATTSGGGGGGGGGGGVLPPLTDDDRATAAAAVRAAAESERERAAVVVLATGHGSAPRCAAQTKHKFTTAQSATLHATFHQRRKPSKAELEALAELFKRQNGDGVDVLDKVKKWFYNHRYSNRVTKKEVTTTTTAAAAATSTTTQPSNDDVAAATVAAKQQ